MPAKDSELMREGWVRFTGLGPRHPAIAALLQVSQLRRLKRGAALMIEGQHDTTLYLLLSGSLRTLRYLSNGQEVWLTDAMPGELVGEIAALTGEARTSSIFARTEASLVALEQSSFQTIASEHGTVSLALARLLARRLVNTTRQMADLVSLPVASRLHRELVRLGRPSQKRGEMVRIDSPPSVSALAQRIHASRETVSRALSELEGKGRVLRDDDAWIIPLPVDDLS